MCKINEPNPLELSMFLASRICHDLISPVGAVVNGLELMDELEDDSERQSTLNLVQQSAQQASARLQLCRFAFGAIGSLDSEIGWAEIRGVLDEYTRWEKTQLTWDEHPESLPKDKAKLLINLVLLAKRCLPRYGMIRIKVNTLQDNTHSFIVESTGEGAFVPEYITQVTMDESGDMQNTDSALSTYSRCLAQMCGMDIAVDPKGGAIQFYAKKIA